MHMESFFATLKKEKLYQIPTYRMKREEVKTVIFRYIFGYYNTQRINSFNAGGLPPVALRTSTAEQERLFLFYLYAESAAAFSVQRYGIQLTNIAGSYGNAIKNSKVQTCVKLLISMWNCQEMCSQ